MGGGGTSGRGTLLIEGGGQVFSPDSGLGSLAGSSATVTGAGSIWLTTGNLEIGNYHGTGGFGTLTAADSGLVRVDGQLTISALSRVVLGAGGAPGTLQVSSIRNDGLLHFNHTGATTFSTPLSGAGRVYKDGSGSTTITNAATLAGPFTVNTGLLLLKNVVGGNSFSANNGGTLRFDAATVNLTSAGAIRANFGGAIEYNQSTVNGGFLRGPGTHMLLAGGNNTFNGVTTFNSTAIVQEGTAYFSNFMNGGTLTANGTLNLDGAVNAASGEITVNGALLANDFTNNGILTINNGATLDNGASNLVSGGGSRTTISSGGTVFLSDDTAWELNGALVVNNGEINGTINVNYGSLAKGSGSYDVVNVHPGGVYAPGSSPGVSTAASVAFANGAFTSGAPKLEIELAGTTPGTQFDRLHVSGGVVAGWRARCITDQRFHPDSRPIVRHPRLGHAQRHVFDDQSADACRPWLEHLAALHHRRTISHGIAGTCRRLQPERRRRRRRLRCLAQRFRHDVRSGPLQLLACQFRCDCWCRQWRRCRCARADQCVAVRDMSRRFVAGASWQLTEARHCDNCLLMS